MTRGLSPEHHGQLNIPQEVYPGGKEAKNVLIKKLRTQYTDDPKAQQQIDVYTGNQEYMTKIRQYVEAHKQDDKEAITELEAWFKENYPDIRYSNIE